MTDEVFNVASGTETSLLDLAQMLTRIMGSHSRRNMRRRARSTRYRAGWPTRKAEQILGFEAQLTLDEGLRDLVAWWRQERSAAAAMAAE